MANEIAAAVWSAIAVAAAPAARWIDSRLSPPMLSAISRLRPLLPWAHGLVPSYGALWTGAVPASFMGVYGNRSLWGWLGSAVLLGLLLLGGSAWLRRRPLTRPADTRFDQVILDEPRWALYRAAGAVWIGNVPWGLLVGLGLGLAEWSFANRVWVQENRRRPAACLELARLAVSAIAFGLSANLWLTMAFQLGWVSMLDPEPSQAA